jgi:hypothetical protein
VVAVEDADLVGGREGEQGVLEDGEGGLRAGRAPLVQQRPQGGPVDHLHDDG